MPATQTYRYQFEKKGSQHPCPACGKRREYTRYLDSKTGELLPDQYGRCNRADRCGYDQSPYQPDERNRVYADEVFEQERQQWNAEPVRRCDSPTKRTSPRITPARSAPQPPANLYTIPDAVFKATLTGYERNNFAGLLTDHFGAEVARDLIQRFHVGTSDYWPGANVFWFIDEVGRVRGGQVVCYGPDHHKAKYTDHEGNRKTCIGSVSHGLLKRYRKQGETALHWLTDYHDNAPKIPVCVGAHQLQTEPTDKPVAIVEGPATAVFCSAYFPAFIWLAVGSLSYLSAERLASMKHRRVRLFPDLSPDGSAYHTWSKRANELRPEGFSIEVDSFLETQASETERTGKYDLRDYLLEQWPGYLPKQSPGPVSSKLTKEQPVTKKPYSQYDLTKDRQLWQDWPRPPLVWCKLCVGKFIERNVIPPGRGSWFSPLLHLYNRAIDEIRERKTKNRRAQAGNGQPHHQRFKDPNQYATRYAV